MYNLFFFLLIPNYFLFVKGNPQQKRFVDKVVIITGSSSGIGRNAAIEFAKEGAKVVIHGRDKKRLEETEALIIKEAKVSSKNVLKVIGPIESEETTNAIFNKTMKNFQKIDILINNVGTVMKPDTKELFDLENLDYIYKVAFRSIVHLTKLCLSELQKRKGVVLNISSLASIRPVALAPFYSAIKAALDQWTRTLALINGKYQVRINSINPGPIANTLLARDMEAEQSEKEKTEEEKLAEGSTSKRMPSDKAIASMTVLGRLGSVGDISSAMKFLCSDEASFITGEILVIDGGMALH